MRYCPGVCLEGMRISWPKSVRITSLGLMLELSTSQNQNRRAALWGVTCGNLAYSFCP